MLLAWALLIIGHWAHGKPTINAKQVIEMVFAILIIAMLDQGNTEGIARGFALLFLVAVLLGNNSPLTALSKVTGTGTTAPGNTGAAIKPRVV